LCRRDLFNGSDFIRPELAESLKIEIFYKNGQRRLPMLLPIIMKLPQALRIHSELSGHLNMSM
jgi:hypothetical protein